MFSTAQSLKIAFNVLLINQISFLLTNMKISLLPFRTRLYFLLKNKNFDYFAMQLLIFFLLHQQMNCYSKSALANRQPKYNIIYKKECQAFFEKFFNFF